MRFPGQYFDSETNLNYNIHRDYNPVWGRYMTSDPLGVAAGINTYSYVGGNSLRYVDKLGLRILRETNGDFKFFSLNKETVDKATYLEGYFLTDKNVQIFVSKFVNGPSSIINDYTTDCHGVTFTNGKYWINNDQVDLILAEEYIKIPFEVKKAGDIGITRKKEGVVHSLTIKEHKNILTAYEKSGIAPGPYLTFSIDLINWIRPLEIYRNK